VSVKLVILTVLSLGGSWTFSISVLVVESSAGFITGWLWLTALGLGLICLWWDTVLLGGLLWCNDFSWCNDFFFVTGNVIS
jgi:hypothetical protein